MAEKLTIARPYAKAVFEQALADHGLEDWQHILQALTAVVVDPQAAALLDNPWLKPEQLAELFVRPTEQLLPKLSDQRKKELKNLVEILIAEKRLDVLPEILQRYQRLMASEQGFKEVTVISAFPLNAERQEKMSASLTQYLRSKVSVDFQVDPALIGGVLIRSGNWVMDDSIKGKLQNLRDNMQK